METILMSILTSFGVGMASSLTWDLIKSNGKEILDSFKKKFVNEKDFMDDSDAEKFLRDISEKEAYNTDKPLEDVKLWYRNRTGQQNSQDFINEFVEWLKENQTIFGNSTITNIWTHGNYYSQNETLSKRYLTDSPAKVNKAQFLYRDIQIAELTEKVKRGENHLFISGFAGVGKTAIARDLYHVLEKEYRHIGWINYNGNLKESILAQVNLYFDEKNQDIRWKLIKTYFTECKNEFLLFVDNITQVADPDLQWLTSLNAHVVITSRLSQIRNFETYEISSLDREQSIAIFYCYYKYDKKQEEKNTVSQLVDLVSFNTLSIELLAGIVNSMKYRGNLNQFLLDLKDKGFGFHDLKTSSSHTPVDATIAEHLAKLFTIAPLNDEQHRILLNFQIIPKGLDVSRELSDWIGCEGNALEDLVNSRWVSVSESGYLMDDIVWESIRIQFPNIPYEYAKKMIDTMVSEVYFNDTDEHTVLRKKIQIAEAYAEYFPDEDTNEWSDFLNLLGIKYQIIGEHGSALDYFKKALGIKEKVLEKDDLDTASIYSNIATAYQGTGEYDKALEYYEKPLGKDHPSTATTYNNIANVYKDKGAYDKALKYYENALAIMAKGLENNPSTAITYNNIASVYQDKGEYDKALEYHEKSLGIREKVLGREHPDTAISYNNIALLYQEKEEYDKALAYYEKALNIMEKGLGKDHPSMATTYNNIANVYQATGEYDKALQYLEKALDIIRKVLGKDHPIIATIYNNIANVYQATGEYTKALEYHEKALFIDEKVLGNDHPDTATTYEGIASVYQDKEEYTNALEYYEKALSIYEIGLGNDHPSTATTYNNIANVYQATEEYDKALAYYEKALGIIETVLGTDHPDTATTYNNIAILYQDTGEYDKALEYLKKALGIREKILETDHPDTATTYNNIAVVYQDNEEYDKALEYYERALGIYERIVGTDHPSTATTYNNITCNY